MPEISVEQRTIPAVEEKGGYAQHLIGCAHVRRDCGHVIDTPWFNDFQYSESAKESGFDPDSFEKWVSLKAQWLVDQTLCFSCYSILTRTELEDFKKAKEAADLKAQRVAEIEAFFENDEPF